MKQKVTILILKAEHPIEKRIFSVLLASLALLGVGYGYFVGTSIFNVIAQKEARSEVAQLQTTVGELEREYFALLSAVDPEQAHVVGLSPIAHTSYVYRPVTVGSAAR